MNDGPTRPEVDQQAEFAQAERIFEEFSKSENFRKISEVAKEYLRSISGDPNARKIFDRGWRGAIFEQIAYLWLSAKLQSAGVSSPDEAIDWYHNLFPRRPIIVTGFQKGIAGLTNFDGLIVSPTEGGDREIAGFCEYTLHTFRSKFEHVYRIFKKDSLLPGVRTKPQPQLIFVTPRRTNIEEEVRGYIRQKDPVADVDEIVKVYQTPFNREQFKALLIKYQMAPPSYV